MRFGVEAEAASLLADVAALDEVVRSCRAENRFAARKVLAAGRFWESWIERDVRLGSGDIVDCGNGAVAELAVRMGCSKTVAESHASLGMDLRLRLPLARVTSRYGLSEQSRSIASAYADASPLRTTPPDPTVSGTAAARFATTGRWAYCDSATGTQNPS